MGIIGKNKNGICIQGYEGSFHQVAARVFFGKNEEKNHKAGEGQPKAWHGTDEGGTA